MLLPKIKGIIAYFTFVLFLKVITLFFMEFYLTYNFFLTINIKKVKSLLFKKIYLF